MFIYIVYVIAYSYNVRGRDLYGTFNVISYPLFYFEYEVTNFMAITSNNYRPQYDMTLLVTCYFVYRISKLIGYITHKLFYKKNEIINILNISVLLQTIIITLYLAKCHLFMNMMQ